VPRDVPFKLVSLTHVIEHLPDPAAVVADLAARLAPGGRIFITAPHRAEGWRRGGGIGAWRGWSCLHVAAHIAYVSRRWFEQVAALNRLKVVPWNPSHENGQAFEAVLSRRH